MGDDVLRKADPISWADAQEIMRVNNELKADNERLRATLGNIEWVLKGDRTDEVWLTLYAYVRRENKK